MPSLSTFGEMIKRKISLSTLDKTSSNEFDNLWVYTNNQKRKNLNNEFRNRIEIIDKEFFWIYFLEELYFVIMILKTNIFLKRMILC